MEFGNKLRTLRKAKGLSQENLAKQLGISRQAISKWESDLSQPDIDKYHSIVQNISDFR